MSQTVFFIPARSAAAYLAVVLAVIPLLAACNHTAHDSRASAPPTIPTSVVDLSTTGSITGTVRLDGPPPSPQTIHMGSEAACKNANSAPVVSTVTVGEDNALANVVVFVKSGLKPYRFETPTQAAVVDQRDCLYEPRIIAVMANQPIEIRNDDATIHNVHAMPKENPEWNKAQRAGAAALEVRFSRPELAIPLLCNVHPWMRAFVFVFPSPYFAVTTREGRFTLKNLPPGSYVIEAWQERYGTLDQSVVIGPRESRSVSFAFRADAHRGD